MVGYVSYNTTTWHLRLLRVETTGDSYEIPLGDWQSYEANNNFQSVYVSNVSLITNADQGVLASYEVDTYPNTGSMTSAFYLATTTGPSIASNTQVAMVPEQASPVQPMLQRQDGSFVGVVSSSVGSFMVGFTPSGGTLFTVPNDSPQIATSNNGVIGTSGTTYDQSGNVTGQNATLLAGGLPGWLANPLSMSYSIASGTITASAFTPISYASTYAALLGGNNSGTGTNIQQEWFPELPSCPLASTPCAKEAIRNALGQLRVRMYNPCPLCSTYVFASNKLGSTQQQFYEFLSRSPRFFDGTRSNAPVNVLCGEGSGAGGFLQWLFCDFGSGTVAQYMASSTGRTAVTQTPSDSGEGIMTFFVPSSICDSLSPSPQAILNQATVFHESLHGYYGRYDLDLQIALGIDTALPSVYISYYLEDNILGQGASACGN